MLLWTMSLYCVPTNEIFYMRSIYTHETHIIDVIRNWNIYITAFLHVENLCFQCGPSCYLRLIPLPYPPLTYICFEILHCWGRPPSKMVWIVQNHTSFLLSSDVDLWASQKFGGFVRLLTSLLEPRSKRFQQEWRSKIEKMQHIRADTSLNGQNPSPESTIK